MTRLNTAVPPTDRQKQSWLGAALCFDPPTKDTDAKLDLTRPGCDSPRCRIPTARRTTSMRMRPCSDDRLADEWLAPGRRATMPRCCA
jgi:hypothetical protein